MDNETIDITISLDEATAWQLAQFCKRATYSTFYDLTEAHAPHATRQQHTAQMMCGINDIAAALAHAGFAPR